MICPVKTRPTAPGDTQLQISRLANQLSPAALQLLNSGGALTEADCRLLSEFIGHHRPELETTPHKLRHELAQMSEGLNALRQVITEIARD